MMEDFFLGLVMILMIQQSHVPGPSDKWPGAIFVLPYSANHVSGTAKGLLSLQKKAG